MKQNKILLRQTFMSNNRIMFIIALVTSIIFSLAGLYVSYVLQIVTDIAAGVSEAKTVDGICIQVVCVLALLIIIGIIEAKSVYRFKETAIRQYKDKVFKMIIQKGIGAFKVESESVYTSGMTNDVSIIEENYLECYFKIGSNIVLFIGALVMMIYSSVVLTLIALGLSIIPILASAFTGTKLVESEKKVSEKNGNFIALVGEFLNGFTVVKCFKAEKKIFGIFSDVNKNLEKTKKKRNINKKIITLIGTFAGIFVQIGVFIIGAWMCLNNKGISPGMLFMFTNLMNYILGPIGELPALFANRKAAIELIKKMENSLNNSLTDETNKASCSHEKGIKICNLEYAYDDKNVLDGISYEFKKGKKYVIVGSSGSGKSTLLQLLLAGMDNYKGTIKYDNSDLKKISTDALYDVVSSIQQNVFIFNSSIRENITMFNNFPKDEVDNVIRMSGLEKVVEAKGEDYFCGENGCDLSGGEKQRISIARALLKKSKILLVDEATAALDTETSSRVANSIINLKNITIIAVTHDLDANILKQYDSILTLKDGKIVEEGDFETLIEKKGYFYSLYTVAQ